MTKISKIFALCLEETRKLTESGSSDLLTAIGKEKFIFNNGSIQHNSLFAALQRYNCSVELLNLDKQLIALPLLQFLTLHISLQEDLPNLTSLADIRQYLQKSFAYKQLMSQWSECGKALIYLEYSGIATWRQLAANSDYNSADIQMLEGSLAFCDVPIDDLFRFIQQVNERNNYPGGLYNTGVQLTFKVSENRRFASDMTARLPDIMSDKVIRQFLPGILKGIINNNSKQFKLLLGEMITNFGKEHLADLLIAFAVACPDDQQSRQLLKVTLKTNQDKGTLSAASYIQVLALANFAEDDVHVEIQARAEKSCDSEELIQLTSYLLNNLTAFNSAWFRQSALALSKKADEKLVRMLCHLFILLVEHDHQLTYELITARFTAIGTDAFIYDHWHTLVQKDKSTFHDYLTSWFLSGERNIYKALLKLCTVRDLDDDDFKLSQVKLAALSQGDKLFIGVKIAGFIYGKDHLQNFMFSLIESIKPSEHNLMQELFNILFNYVIYNYRSVLDAVKVLLKSSELPTHQRSFYQSLDYYYEQYFAQLKTVRNFAELRPDRKLVEHLQFYSQQKFTEEFKKTPRPAWADFGKSVTLHSHRWAIRRREEPKHLPAPLNHIETSAEFPSGERLNPIFQETLRRTYQKLKRDEINLN